MLEPDYCLEAEGNDHLLRQGTNHRKAPMHGNVARGKPPENKANALHTILFRGTGHLIRGEAGRPAHLEGPASCSRGD